MTWEILWALILGFFLAAVVQAVVRRAAIVRLVGDDRPRNLGIGVRNCGVVVHYAAVALARFHCSAK